MNDPVFIDYPKNSDELQRFFRSIVSDPAFVRSVQIAKDGLRQVSKAKGPQSKTRRVSYK